MSSNQVMRVVVPVFIVGEGQIVDSDLPLRMLNPAYKCWDMLGLPLTFEKLASPRCGEEKDPNLSNLLD